MLDSTVFVVLTLPFWGLVCFVLKMSGIYRRKILSDMLGSEGAFLLDGKAVCASFLFKAFRFWRDLQCSVRGTTGVRCGGNYSSCRAVAIATHALEYFSPGKEAIITFLERLPEDTVDNMPYKEEKQLPFFRKDDSFAEFLRSTWYCITMSHQLSATSV